MSKHTFESWNASRESGLQRVMVQAGEGHSTCKTCGVFAKRVLGSAGLGQPARKHGPIKYWIGKWTSKSPKCEAAKADGSSAQKS